MSRDSAQGVGAVLCARAALASAISASAATTVFVETPVIVHSPANQKSARLTQPAFEQITNVILPSRPWRDRRARHFVIPRYKLRGYLPLRLATRLYSCGPRGSS